MAGKLTERRLTPAAEPTFSGVTIPSIYGSTLRAKNNANLAQGNALAAIAEGKSVRSTLLRKETLFAGDEVAGATYFALKDRGRLTIKIPAGQDTHTFYFEAQEN